MANNGTKRTNAKFALLAFIFIKTERFFICDEYDTIINNITGIMSVILQNKLLCEMTWVVDIISMSQIFVWRTENQIVRTMFAFFFVLWLCSIAFRWVFRHITNIPDESVVYAYAYRIPASIARYAY
jgi:hypothetical protein